MPAIKSKVVLRDFDAYCSAPPLTTSSHLLLPPRLTRAQEARRTRAPLCDVKPEVRELEADSVEFVVDEDDEEIKPDIRQPKIEPDPRQLTVKIAALAIRQPTSAASTSSEEAQRPGPSSSYRT